ncbi:MAG: nucleoside kinase [Spirochaetales bacterium]|uniref:Nucleoside kinase n=1 Tax=Candidatus Thalassospirochaeta sargassi TaxID=3119039 RepID=A0AAJ1MIB4_9SPIO|nr:nucleoside kinase [Spirochaetales bacterium]
MKDLKVRFSSGHDTTVNYGTDILTILKDNGQLSGTEYPVTSALVNNELVSLSSRLKINAEVKPVFLNSATGARVYRKTLTALLSKVCSGLFPERRLIVGHSLSTGYVCYFDGMLSVDKKDFDAIRKRIQELIDENLKIAYEIMSYEDACTAFESNESKMLILKYRNESIIPVYRIRNWIDLAYEPLLPETGMLNKFELMPYGPGFILRYPHASSPDRIETFEDNHLLKSIYTEYKAWGKILNVTSAGKLNNLRDSSGVKDFIRVAESLHEKKLSQISDMIAAKGRDIRVVLIAGPSSSGKTTFTKKLAIHLKVLGYNPQLISLDDYYVNREETPRDEYGELDFEALEAIDIPQLNTDMLKLFDGEEVELPSFNFKTGLREYRGHKIRMESRNILLMEGIHGLNDKLTAKIRPEQKFKIYISALTQLNLDDNNRIATTDNRLIRRIVRDFQFRGYDALHTLGMWESVKRGEKKNIFPFQNNADAFFNSALDYELAVLKNLAVPVLKAVKPWDEAYAEASRLLLFLNNFTSIQPKYVPMTSILREFIGDSDFKY